MDSEHPEGRFGLDRLCRLFEAAAMALLVVMTAFIAIQVGARNLFALGLPWAEELARYAGLGVVYLAVPVLLLKDSHIKVDLLSTRLGSRTARALRIANELVVLGFAIAFLWGGWLFLKRAAHFSTAALGIPNWLYYLPAAIGMTLFALVAARRVLRAMRRTDKSTGR